MEKLLEEIDDLLARFEDFTHGKDGDDITKMRKKIRDSINEYRDTGKICEHPNTEFIAGIFGGHWCNDCQKMIDKD